MKPPMTYHFAHAAAAADAANRNMRKNGRKKWSLEDWNVAVAEFDRLIPENKKSPQD